MDRDIFQVQSGENLAGFLRQLEVALDGVNLASPAAQNAGLVTRAGADLQHAFVAIQLQQIGHQRDNVGLRNGLPDADRQRAVFIGIRPIFLAQELMAGQAAEGFQHARGKNAAPFDLPAHHAIAEGREIRFGHRVKRGIR